LIKIRLTYAKPVWMLDGNIRESAEPAIMRLAAAISPS